MRAGAPARPGSPGGRVSTGDTEDSSGSDLGRAFGFMAQFFKDSIYLFLERRKEGEIVGEKHQCGCLSHAPNGGPGPQQEHVP